MQQTDEQKQHTYTVHYKQACRQKHLDKHMSQRRRVCGNSPFVRVTYLLSISRLPGKNTVQRYNKQLEKEILRWRKRHYNNRNRQSAGEGDSVDGERDKITREIDSVAGERDSVVGQRD